MSNNPRKSLAAPDGWADVFVRTVIVFVVAFVSLNLKEWLDVGLFDIPACAIDAACVAGGTFVFYAILALTSRGARTQDRLAVPAAR
jgi:hypothetical protein